jgi:hypothetical protein
MLLSDGEREELFELLKRHAALGRLDIEELERRVTAEPVQRRERPRARRGHGDVDRPRPDWTPTAERFRDPRSARIMRVWTDARGGRHYVPDE